MTKDVLIALITFILFSVAMAGAGHSLGPVIGDAARSFIAAGSPESVPSADQQPGMNTKTAKTEAVEKTRAPSETAPAPPAVPENEAGPVNTGDEPADGPKPPLTLVQADEEMGQDLQAPEPIDELTDEEPAEILVGDDEPAAPLEEVYEETDMADMDDPMEPLETDPETDSRQFGEQPVDDMDMENSETPFDQESDPDIIPVRGPVDDVDEAIEAENIETDEAIDSQPVSDPAAPGEQTAEPAPAETGPVTKAEPDSDSPADQTTLAKAGKTVSERIKALENGNSIRLPDGRIAYKVKSGDTFSQICKKIMGTGSKDAWKKEAERQGIDYRAIYPGKVLYFKGDYGN